MAFEKRDEWLEKFHDHIDVCHQCRDNPKSLCNTGEHYMAMRELTKDRDANALSNTGSGHE